MPGQPGLGNVPNAVTNAIFNPPTSATGGAFGNPQPGIASGSAFQNQAAGGLGTGIAGVGVPAEYKGEGIMVVKERKKYREWEFIYDPKEDKNIVGAAGAQQNQQMQQGQGQGQNPGLGLGQSTPTPSPTKP